MACETACPSGVRYAPLIEHTRAVDRAAPRRGRWPTGCFAWLLFPVLPYPARLRLLAAAACRRPSRSAASPASWRCFPLRLRNLLTLAPDGAFGTARRPPRSRRPRRAAAERRPGHRLRPAGVLRRGQRGDRQGPGRGRLRRVRASRPGMLRRARAARGPRRRRPRVRPSADRRVRVAAGSGATRSS